jgi:electron transfer flavoprotein alpha subunit
MHGKSKTASNKLGTRRSINGKDLAPRSARRKGKHLLTDCTQEELKKAKII